MEARLMKASTTQSASDVVVAGIRDLILTGQLNPGERLPPEAALADRFNLSRASIREGVRVLATARVLQVRQGDGTYVTSLEPSLLLEGIGFAVDMMREDSALELLEMRRLLEPQAVSLASMRITPNQLQAVQATLQAMTQADSHVEFVRLDADFHELINRASGNTVLAAVLHGVSRPSHRARVWRDILESGASARTLQQHQRILAALIAHQPTEAYEAALDHVRTTEGWFVNVVNGQSPAEPRPPADPAAPDDPTQQDPPTT